jgi:hypothetical protein
MRKAATRTSAATLATASGMNRLSRSQIATYVLLISRASPMREAATTAAMMSTPRYR